jgi:hypothetical protein
MMYRFFSLSKYTNDYWEKVDASVQRRLVFGPLADKGINAEHNLARFARSRFCE